MPDTCIRDWAGFCWLASWGWPKCFSGKDREQCIEKDPAGNLEAARQRHAQRQIALNENSST